MERPQSMIQWFVSAMGPKYMILLPLAAIIALVVTVVLIVRGRGWCGRRAGGVHAVSGRTAGDHRRDDLSL